MGRAFTPCTMYQQPCGPLANTLVFNLRRNRHSRFQAKGGNFQGTRHRQGAAMADVFSRAKRSEVMRAVRRSCTTDENLLYESLLALGIRPRRNVASLPGKPDLVIGSARLIVFVDGDFWHGKAWFSEGCAPRSNRSFWTNRFEENRRRDLRVSRRLRRMGWSVRRVWTSDVRRNTHEVARRISMVAHRLCTQSRDVRWN